MNAQTNTKVIAAKIAVGLGVIPLLVYAHALGPDPRRTGAPGDIYLGQIATCAISGCHVSTPLNGGGGSVVLTSSAGTTYTPGQQQTITITITDSKAKVYGFQLTARLDSSPTLGQAGDFTAGTQQIILCDDGALKPNGKLCGANQSVEFIEHGSPFQANKINVTWTPPSTNAGTVTLYAAANAANGDKTELGDHIYTTQLTLCPVLGSGQPAPSITSVQSAGGFSSKAGVSPGTWLEIYGKNFAAASCLWQGADFNGVTAPTTLGGVNVTLGAINAYVDYVSSGQVNVQVPDGVLPEGVPLILSNSGGQSAPFVVAASSLAPALLAPAQAPFMVNNKQYVVGQLSDHSFAGIPSHPAKSGDIMTVYGIGFGPVTPAVPAGTIAPNPPALLSNVTFLFNQVPADVQFAGLAPGFVGLYQFNIKVPAVAPSDYALKVKVGDVTVNQTLFITIGP